MRTYPAIPYIIHQLLKILDTSLYIYVTLTHSLGYLRIFGNKADSMDDLETVLGDLFDEVEVWQSGYLRGVWKSQATC